MTGAKVWQTEKSPYLPERLTVGQVRLTTVQERLMAGQERLAAVQGYSPACSTSGRVFSAENR